MMMEPAAAFSSNNPFRTRSPFDEDNTNAGLFTPPQPIPSRTASAQEERPFSFFQNDEAAAVSSTHSLPDQSAFATRHYNTTNARNASQRKSTNPFLEDMTIETKRAPPPPPPQPRSSSLRYNNTISAPRGGETGGLNVQKTRAAAPPVPPASTKPGRGRSNSDSSAMDVPVVREKERREKPHRHKSEKKHRSKKKVHTDTIDKLDVTGFFGPGSFHHDGPFDACNPHRNKVKNKGPMSAFPVNSANNQLGGADPNKDKYATENRILCRDVDEAYLDYSRKGNNGTPTNGGSSQGAFNPSAKTDPVHGDLTWGLGSSTFLDGAPASKSTISQSQADAGVGAGGLGRKKSLVQRLRGGNGPGPTPPPREHQPHPQPPRRTDHSDPTTRHTSLDDEPALAPPRKGSDPAAEPSPPAGNGLLRRVKSLKVGSRRRAPS